MTQPTLEAESTETLSNDSDTLAALSAPSREEFIAKLVAENSFEETVCGAGTCSGCTVR